MGVKTQEGRPDPGAWALADLICLPRALPGDDREDERRQGRRAALLSLYR